VAKKYTINDMHNLAESRGGQCLSDKYSGVKYKLLWKCKEAHTWRATPDTLLNRGTWCTICVRSRQQWKYSIEDMRRLGRERDGECLSVKYLGIHTTLRWKCDKGHEWNASPSSIVNQKSWCKTCKGMDKHTIEEMQRIAESRGGRCLSSTYHRAKDNLQWECQEGHRWFANADNIKNKAQWCKACKGLMRDTIENMRKIARQKGGECLSGEYINSLTKLDWRCSAGHEWAAVPGSIKSGTWCPHCAFTFLNIEDLDKHAEALGGKCISREFVNTKTNMLWECQEEHRWLATSSSVVGKRKSWCPVCSGNTRLSLEAMREIASARGGECISDEYTDIDSKMKWRCAFGHEWEATGNKIKNAHQWCPHCSSSFGENYCRALFEMAFKKKFPRVRPKWLSIAGKNPLELDGFNEELNLAFEHQGHQHYAELSSHFHASTEEKEQQLQRDQIKRDRCKDFGVTLIEIPEVGTLTSVADTPNVILKELTKNGIKPIIDIINCNVDPNTIFAKKVDLLRSHAVKNSGKYLGMDFTREPVMFHFECCEGHHFHQSFRTVNKGRWCTKCSGRQRKTIEDMHALAAEKDGQCLSKIYINNIQKLQWSCENGHVFEKSYSKVHQGQWCMECMKATKRL
jgi:hypothetical protein